MATKKLRVALFMRGSTNKQGSAGLAKKQARSGKESARKVKDEIDLPLQKEKCMEYIDNHPEWEFTGLEYIEAGVSGFHTPVSKRVGLNQAFEDAKKGMFDILLVYKVDRLGRRSIESYNHAVKFLRFCRIWFVDKDREFTNTSDADEIINFIEFWSAKKASMDTKVRVTDAMKLMHEEGVWTGGNPPYGFENHPEVSNMLRQVPQEVEIVKEIFRLYTSEGYGLLKISGTLNERGVRTRTGKLWNVEGVRKIIANSVYKGHLSYGKTKNVEGEFGGYQKRMKVGEEHISPRYWEEYDIVGKATWDVAQSLKKSRYTSTTNFTECERTIPNRKGTSRGLLTSLLYCECGSCMSYSITADWADHKRTHKKDPYPIYRCLTRTRSGVSACGAKKGSYKVEFLEPYVIDHVKNYIKELIDSDMLKDIQQKTLVANKEINERIDNAKHNIEMWTTAKKNMDNEMMKIMMGQQSRFPEEMIRENYDKAVAELEQANRVMTELKSLNDANGLTECDIMKLQDLISSWGDMFDEASHEEKKRLLSALVKEIRLDGAEVKIEINLEVSAFFEVVASLQTDNDRSSNSSNKAGTVKPFLHTIHRRDCNGINITSIKRTFTQPIQHTILLEVA